GYVRALAAPTPSGTAAQGPIASSTTSDQQALVDKYCVGCHNRRARVAGLALDTVDVGHVGENAETWEKVVQKLRGGLMPPAGRPRPDETTNRTFVSWLESQLDRAAATNPNVGRTQAFHRLNRGEYRNAVRDVLGIDIDVTALLPADDASYGFDNIAGSLKVNQSLMERYLSAALKISRAAVGSPLPAPAVDEFSVSDATQQDEQAEDMPVGTRGGKRIRYNFPQDGDYTFKITLTCGPPSGIGRCDGAGGFDDVHQLEVTVDGERVKLWVLEPRLTTTFNDEGWQ